MMMISMLEGEINLQAVVIANVLGFGLMLIVMLNKRYRRKIITLDDKLYNWMCYLCMVLCLVEIATFWVDGKGFSGARQLNVGGNALLYLLSALFAYLWCFYWDHKCFSDLHRLRRWYGLAAIPAVGVLLVCVANLFVPIMFWVGEDNQFYRTNWVVVCYLVTFGYLTAGALLVFWYRRKGNKYLFMPVMTFIIPVYLGCLAQLLCYGIATIWVSVALGLTALYINLQKEQVYLDPLTALYNRNYLMHYLQALSQRRRKGGRILGLLLDVNDFKRINDTYGHLCGDEVLQQVARILQQALEVPGAVIRYGGDEFVVIWEESPQESGQQLQEKIHRYLAVFNASGKSPCPISVSIGMGEFDLVNKDAFFHDMDKRMYSQKQDYYQKLGRDRRRARDATIQRKEEGGHHEIQP